jgi:proteic killer suppression protein
MPRRPPKNGHLAGLKRPGTRSYRRGPGRLGTPNHAPRGRALQVPGALTRTPHQGTRASQNPRSDRQGCPSGPSFMTPNQRRERKAKLYRRHHPCYDSCMKIRNVIHRGLRRFIERDDASGLSPAVVEKVRNIVTFLQEMEDARELRDVPSWRVHQLTGDRKGTWSLTVTRNWRLTFRIDRTEGEILDLNYEDYHGRS